jgi:hypothetical protein
MSVRKRKWTTRSGNPREAWVVDYVDQRGERHIETFAKKKDADARRAEVKVDVIAGVHVAPSKSVTVREAGEGWIKAAGAAGLERSTIKQYREHVDQHIVPFIGELKLSEVSAQSVRRFEDLLREKGRSPAMVRKVVGSLGSLLADAQEQRLTAKNAVRDLHRNRRRGKGRHAEKRHKGKLKVGVDIPHPDESELGLVFPNGAGNVESLGNIINRGLIPAQVAAGVTVKDKAKYTGMHTLRHFYASWCINRPDQGGLGLPPKVVQERLGHSSITMTYDRYGHLFPRGEDAKELDAAEQALLA